MSYIRLINPEAYNKKKYNKVSFKVFFDGAFLPAALATCICTEKITEIKSPGWEKNDVPTTLCLVLGEGILADVKRIQHLIPCQAQ